MELISPSWNPGARDRTYVGGKAYSLFKLLDLGAPVPPFFVLTTSAYRSSKDGKLGAELRSEVGSALMRLGNGAVAVRSSATAEDSADHSFAGVFESVLDVKGLDQVCEAIEYCWKSHAGARARSYLEDRGVGTAGSMAVIVQKMIAAEWAGVAFTADPVTRSLGTMVIDAVPGIGEALVSGLVTPEQIKVSREGAVIERHRPHDVEALPDAVLEGVLEQSRNVAEKLDFPQDIEWAFRDGQTYLLQARPVTTIRGVFHNRSLESVSADFIEDPARRWTRAYADEVWTPPVSPLFYDVQNLSAHLLTRLKNDGETANLPPTVFKYYEAAPYADAALLARVYSNLPPVARRPSLLAQLPKEERAKVERTGLRIRPLLHRLWNFEVRNRKKRSLFHTHRFLEQAWPSFLERSDELAKVDVSSLATEELDRHLSQIWDLALLVGVECEVAVLYHAHDLKLILSGILDRWVGEGDEAYGAISSGLLDSHTVRESEELWQLATDIRKLPKQLIAKLQSASFREVAETTEPQLAPISSTLQRFLARHRHRGANYKDLIHPRWGDDPDLLWKQVLALVADPGQRPRDRNQLAAARRRDAQAMVLAALSGPRALYRRPLLRRMFAYNEIYAGLRDNHRFYYDNVWWLLRRFYREKGRRLVEQKSLGEAEDVFFLSRSEIEALADSSLTPALAAERIQIRRTEWENTLRISPPKFLQGAYAPVSEETGEAVDALKGIPASPGEAKGRARVLYDVSELGKVLAGEILVTRQTDPSWTPAFSRLSGLVLETGGALAHGASLCREFGLPCVTAIERGTALIRDGDLLLVSGGEGLVAILERATEASTEQQ
jgi:pyruvate,water dikinase